MITQRKRFLIKKLAAATLAVIMSFSVFTAFGQNGETPSVFDTAMPISADEQDPAAEYDRQLGELDEKKKALDQKIASAGSDVKGKQEKLDAVNEKAETIKKKITKLAKKTSALEDEMAQLDSEMRDTQYELEQSEQKIGEGIDDFKSRLRTMYVAGTETYSEVLINANSFYDVLMRVELVKRVAEHDNEAIDSLLEQKSEVEKYQAQLDEQSDSLKEKSAEYAKRQKQLSEQQAELLQLSQEYGASIETLNGDISSYMAQASDIAAEYDRVSEKRRTATTTTTTVTTTAPESKDKDKDNDKDDGKATTTKKDPSSDDSGGEPEVPKTTTTTTSPQTQAPPETTEPPETDPERPAATTTAPPTTTKPKTTTTPPPQDDPPASDDRQTQVDIVVNYAKGMVGGSYVWAGERYGATDCSGLVMLSYRQVGINLPHLASAQASYGTNVSYNDLMPGDLVFFGGSSYSSIYHVAMYIGDGKIVHAESTATGIVISYLSSVSKYNNITCMKRLL